MGVPRPEKPTSDGEIRGVWHRVHENTPEAIAGLAEALSAAHVNAFFPETVYGSQAMHVDRSGLYPKFERYGDMDALAVLIRECRKRGIEVHAWVHCLFIGIRGNPEEPAALARAHPEWLARNRQGQTESPDARDPAGRGYVFLNPAHPEVRRALIDAYVALARDYRLDGLHLDYIRYGGRSTWQRGWGYSDVSRRLARKALGFDPMEVTPDGTPDRWKQWLAWREEQITSFVREVRAAVRMVRPDLRITAAIFPNLGEAVAEKGQNWAAWARKGYVDALVPMAYTKSPQQVASAVRTMRTKLPSAYPVVAGLGPFLGLSQRQLFEQIQAGREAGAVGQCLFCWNRLSPEIRSELAAGPWRERATPVWKRR
jgi:uncharacterized lipoprotein YddW (UPF0748 family)